MDNARKTPDILSLKLINSKYLFSIILPGHIIPDTKGEAKEILINEFLICWLTKVKLLNRDIAFKKWLDIPQICANLVGDPLWD
jgi:hypothetical protein